MWIIVFVVILFISFITFKKANHHNECNDKKDETLSPQIDIKALESKIPLNNPPINDTHKFAQKNAKEITTSNNNDDIVWTAELMRIKSIMFLTPKHRHKTHSSATISYQKHKERYNNCCKIKVKVEVSNMNKEISIASGNAGKIKEAQEILEEYTSSKTIPSI